MHFPVFLDTNVLYPASLADTVLRLAEAEVCRPHWSPHVMEELERNLATAIGPERAARRCRTMEAAFPEAMVSGYEPMIDAMENDPKDRHVLAAATHAGCEVIVTFNLKDFPQDALASHNVEAVHPDDFLLDQFDLYPQRVAGALVRQAAATARPNLTLIGLLQGLERTGLAKFGAEFRRRWPDLGVSGADDLSG